MPTKDTNCIIINDLVSDRESRRYLDESSRRWLLSGMLQSRRLIPTVMVDKVVKINPIRPPINEVLNNV